MIESFPTEPRFLNLEWLFLQVYNFSARLLGTDTFTFGKLLDAGKVFLILIIILVLFFLIYFLVRLYELQQESVPKKEKKNIAEKQENVVTGDQSEIAQSTLKNETWERIRQNGYSEDESKWRLAIIEADIYMDKLLEKRGYTGETVSDKLKKITENQLASLQYAWEAHKVRNRIAHEGADFVLTFPETRRILLLFEVVFRELDGLE